MTANIILNATGILELLDAIHDFCVESCMRDDDTECMKLKEEIENKTGSDIHLLLSAYLSACDDGDEVIDALYEFLSNCKEFAEAEREETKQITKTAVEAVLDDCEEKCGIKTCIETEYIIQTAEIPLQNNNREFETRFKNNQIVWFLPMVDLDINIEQYISETLGGILYEALLHRLIPETIKSEMNRYIPETRKEELSCKQLFKKYFYSVVQYKERKPGIYPRYDEHIKCTIVTEFFKKIIKLYLRE